MKCLPNTIYCLSHPFFYKILNTLFKYLLLSRTVSTTDYYTSFTILEINWCVFWLNYLSCINLIIPFSSYSFSKLCNNFNSSSNLFLVNCIFEIWCFGCTFYSISIKIYIYKQKNLKIKLEIFDKYFISLS